MKNIFSVFVLVIILSGCGYNSIYTKNEEKNFEILSLEIKGDKDINYLIERRLKQYIGTDNTRKFQVRINTKYFKKPFAKDKTGKIINYKLILDLDLEFEINNRIQNIYLNETFNMENFSDKFEEKKYEKQIKNNFSILMLDKIIPYLANFE